MLVQLALNKMQAEKVKRMKDEHAAATRMRKRKAEKDFDYDFSLSRSRRKLTAATYVLSTTRGRPKCRSYFISVNIIRIQISIR